MAKTLTIEDLTRPAPESTDPDYLAWRDEKVRAALAQVRAEPDSVIPLRDVMKQFGLEY